MHTSHTTILAGLIFFFSVCLIAVVGYCLAGWELIDAIYMVVITVYGVGYGEVRTIDDPGLKVFTMLVIIAGCTSAIYVFGGFVQLLVEGELNRVIGARRMKFEISRLENHVILCGFGRVGQILSRELLAHQIPLVIIDQDETRLQLARELGYLVVSGNATEEEALLAAGVKQARYLAAVLSDDVLNVFVTMTVKELNTDLIILARAENPATERKLKLCGAHQVVLPATIGARRIAENILQLQHQSATKPADKLETLSLSTLEQNRFYLQQYRIDEQYAGYRVFQLEQLVVIPFLLIEIQKTNGEQIKRPGHQQQLEAGDLLSLLGPADLTQKMQLIAKELPATSGLRYRGAIKK